MFSEKNGYRSIREMQMESVSDSLRTRVWNVFYINEIKAGGLGSERLRKAMVGEITLEDRMLDRLGLEVDDYKYQKIKDYIMHCEWYGVYDFIEEYLELLPKEVSIQRSQEFNTILEQEKSAYRMVNNEVIPITNPIEVKEIEKACNTDLETVNQHMRKAVELFCDREKPDYENAVKESVSAVEAICCIITEEEKGTLGKTIKTLKDKGIHIHSAMEKAMSALYGYASDEDGIRHGGKDFHNVPLEDARYVIITCSAFVNYLVEKWRGLRENKT